MKKVSIIFIVCLAGWACNSESGERDKTVSPDSLAPPIDNTGVDKDTSSYERMPNKLNDSMP